MTNSERARIASIIAQAWADDAGRQRYDADTIKANVSKDE
jgi:hypothetical protein